MKRILTTWTVCLILSIGLAAAQVAKVTGWVVSEEEGEPVIGATVLVKGTTQGTITDTDGKFELKDLPKEAKSLQISFIGMQTQEVTIQPNLRIVLKPETELLEEVVVTGYGVTKKAAFTGAATTVGTSKIAGKNDANPIKALEGNVPGLHMNINTGQPGAPVSIFLRGQNSINSGTQPLYIIDGVPFNAETMGANQYASLGLSPLATLNSSDIESLTVLKDATATSIYGARAANGVIVITTKQGKAGRPQINFSAKVGFQSLPSYPRSYHIVNAKEYLELTTEALLNGYESKGSNSIFGFNNEANELGLSYDPAGALEFLDWYTGGWYSDYRQYGTDTDWLDEVTRHGLMQEYSFDISGGDANGKSPVYFLSLNYTDEEAFVIGKGMKRYSFRYNMEHKPFKRVKYGFQTNFSFPWGLTEESIIV
jgi:TonB-linked SusC/RagA family outer membrane protein